MAIKTLWAACIVACGMSGGAQAQPSDAARYPSRPITMVVPAAAGGATDVVARVMAEQLGKRLGQAVVVDNKTGASGMLGATAVARAAPDGYTLLLSYSTPVFYTHHTFPKMNYDIKKDFAFITQVAATSLLLLVHESVPAKNMKEFMAWAKSGPGKNYGSYGPGTPGHLMSAYLSDSRKLGMTHVPYKSEAPLVQDLAGGVVPWGMGTLAAGQGMITSGRMRPIAVLGPQRVKELPDVPTMAEQGFPDPEFNTVAWFTLLAPAATPKPILDRLEKEAVEVIHSTAMKARFQVLGLESVKGGSAQFHKDFEAVDPLIAKLVKISGVKLE